MQPDIRPESLAAAPQSVRVQQGPAAVRATISRLGLREIEEDEEEARVRQVQSCLHVFHVVVAASEVRVRRGAKVRLSHLQGPIRSEEQSGPSRAIEALNRAYRSRIIF